jgi:hypothetical protein
MNQYDALYAQCQAEAERAGARNPQGLGESMADNWLRAQGTGRFQDSPRAYARWKQWTDELYQQRLQQLRG